MDIEKSLLLTSETYSGAILSDTKIPQMFELYSIGVGKLVTGGEDVREKETSEPIGKTTDTDENPSDLRGDTALSQNSDVSQCKFSNNVVESQ